MYTTFPHAYAIEQLTELPSAAPKRYFYPGASGLGGHDGLLVKVRPVDGEAWLGTFAFGHSSPRGISGIFSTPDPQRICVVSRGAGYLVNIALPTDWELVSADPIMDARPILAQGIIVFADWTDLVAYGADGMKWRTNRLACDGLTITEVTENHIKGTFSKGGEAGCFAVNLKTGEHVGG